jgi:probable HAF family extracellular repeat protein
VPRTSPARAARSTRTNRATRAVQAVTAALTVAAVCAVTHAPTSAAAPVRYRLSLAQGFTTAGTCSFTDVVAVNGSGQAVGSAPTGNPFWNHGFVIRGGRTVELYGLGGPTPPRGLEDTAANGINDRNDVVGQSQLRNSPDSPPHAVLWRGGGGTPLDLGTGYPGTAAFSTARDVNSSGTVVGSRSERQDAPRTAVAWVGGRLTPLPGLGGVDGPWGTTSEAVAVNEAGLVVGNARTRDTTQPPRAVLWRGGVVKNLGTLVPGAESSFANAVNDKGVVVGSSFDTKGTSGFRWAGGVMTRLPSLAPDLDWPSAEANGINGSGVVVGTSFLGADPEGYLLYAATIWRDGVAKDLNTMVVNPVPGLALSYGKAVNDTGVIVGTAEYTSGACRGVQQGFVLTPTA